MGFKELIGQEKAVKLIKEGLRSGRLNHGYLYYGPENRGKFTFALGAAKALNCFQEKEDYCGACLSCEKIDKGVHPDLRVIEAQQGKSIKIEQIKKVKGFSSSRPHEGLRKVIIIKDAQLMTLPAANSLLKLLEEPPSYLYFILTSPALDLVPPTIISRCQLVPFGRVSRQKIYSYLSKNSPLTEDELKGVVHLADGSMGRALSMISSPDWKDKRERYLKRTLQVLSGEEKEIFIQAEELAGEEDLFDYLEFLESFLRDSLVYHAGGDKDLLINVDFYNEIETEGNIPSEKLLYMMKEVEGFKKNLPLPLNRRLSLEALLVKMKG
ncbi:MAG: hypothetical protein D5R97_05220 [Candidatus Syntrophonatronum acetioxidans]|uniref:DNA polymerase III subunit delta' n=1 Tax=Candidatus Syntrophonatronum acetioxidans TaxID=1795816 RepID=A0A424YEM3_9FIRM|nr:MAG: hypothetical protein D5R97_05220 [Candidatus Syntrophonatronum acetioxidans]